MSIAVYLINAKRTPMGAFGGSLSALSAIQLGSHAIGATLDACSVSEVRDQVDEVLFGNVLSANLGQAPARQAALGAGIGNNVPCTTVNKVCSSGLKAIMLATQSIALGHADLVVAGGMESMSNVPYYLPQARTGYRYGHGSIVDGLLHDGLWEAYNQFPMGNCAEHIAQELAITRADQDAYAIQSYRRATQAADEGLLAGQIAPIEVVQKKQTQQVSEDEEIRRVRYDKVPTLRPVFSKTGTVTAANASTMNDGAAAVLLASEAFVQRHSITPLGRIVAYADAAREPLYFTTAPTLALQAALQRADLSLGDIDYFEINEAFAVVALANQQLLKLNPEYLNVWGGAVALGHPLACSGARLVINLFHILAHHQAKRGAISICNGGGGASAMIIET